MERKCRTPTRPRHKDDVELVAKTSTLISNYRAFDLFTTAAGEEDLRKILAQWKEEPDQAKRSSEAWDVLKAYFESAPLISFHGISGSDTKETESAHIERFAHYVNVMQMLKEFIYSYVPCKSLDRTVHLSLLTRLLAPA